MQRAQNTSCNVLHAPKAWTHNYRCLVSAQELSDVWTDGRMDREMDGWMQKIMLFLNKGFLVL